MKRRGVVVTGAAVAAATAGVGTALWRQRDRADGGTTASSDPWSYSFESLSGAPVSMAALRGQRLLLNFWATWCAPCVTEMPLLDDFARRHAGAGWRVLAVAIDRPEAVRDFVARGGLSLPVAVATTTALDMSRSLGNTLGALPFTAVFDRTGAKAAIRLGAVAPSLLEEWLGKTR